jgi:tripartite-type tricarboxylate transporter receptor subunit TctC
VGRTDSTTITRRGLLRSTLGALALSAAGCRGDEPAFPGREIRVIVHAAAGGMSDTVARYTARGMNELLGVPVICENRVGAMGAVAFSVVRDALPDGYTVGYTPVEMAVIPNLRYTDIRWQDFDMLARHHRAAAVVGVSASSPWHSLQDLVAAMRQPGRRRLALGTAGPASVWHLGGLSLARQVGASIIYVPFPGSAPAVTALLGGHTDFIVAGVPELQGVVRGGAVRMIGLMSDARSSAFPDVPTAREQGIDLVFEAWGGFMVPKGVPAERKALLSQSILQAFDDPPFREYCRTSGLEVNAMGPDEFTAFVEAEARRFARIVEEEGLVTT